MMRIGLTIFALLTLVACSGGTVQQTALQVLLDERSATSSINPRFTATLERRPSPALEVQVPSKGTRGLLLLEDRQGRIENWISSDAVSLTFDRGLLVGTRGLGAGLLASDVSASADQVLSGRNGSVERVHTFLNGNNEAIIRAFSCSVKNEGGEIVELDRGSVAAMYVTETCLNLDQTFTNEYWVDPIASRIVRSLQWSGEFAGRLLLYDVYDF